MWRWMMADVNARTELTVTTGPIRGSRKVYVGPLKVAMREIDLEPSCGEPPLRVYDTSGPYTDPAARIDIMRGLPQLRRDWNMQRADVQESDGRPLRPEATGKPRRADARRVGKKCAGPGRARGARTKTKK